MLIFNNTVFDIIGDIDIIGFVRKPLEESNVNETIIAHVR